MDAISQDQTQATVWVLDIVGLVLAISPGIIYLGLTVLG